MIAVVCARVGPHRYAVEVDGTGGVLAHEPLEPLPSARPGVLGLLRGEDGERTLPVLSLGGTDGEHVVVLRDAAHAPFGLLVDEVLGVVRVDPGAVGPPPRGQQDPVVRGVVGGAGRGALLLDPEVLSRRLDP